MPYNRAERQEARAIAQANADAEAAAKVRARERARRLLWSQLPPDEDNRLRRALRGELRPPAINTALADAYHKTLQQLIINTRHHPGTCQNTVANLARTIRATYTATHEESI